MQLFPCRHEAINAEGVESPPEFAGFDAVVFGEVLKHSVNPLELLTDCVEHVRLDCHVELPASAQRRSLRISANLCDYAHCVSSIDGIGR